MWDKIVEQPKSCDKPKYSTKVLVGSIWKCNCGTRHMVNKVIQEKQYDYREQDTYYTPEWEWVNVL